MPVHPVLIIAFFLLFIFCIIIGLVSHLPIGAQSRTRPLRKLVYGGSVLFLVTEQCGNGGSSNSDIHVAKALKNQHLALSVTLKLIQKEG